MTKVVTYVFSMIGFFFIAISIILSIQYSSVLQALGEFDPKAKDVYLQMAQRIIETGSGIEAMVIKMPVEEGLSTEDVDQSIRSIANELNIKNVGELPMYKEVEAMSGKPFRFIKIYLLCNAMTAASMLNYSDSYSSYLPCRVSLIEDKSGALWLYTLDMDIMIYGGKTLPPALKDEALKIKNTIMDIMSRSAEGDF
jgi:uncharacterized protein (DUF302 family)